MNEFGMISLVLALPLVGSISQVLWPIQSVVGRVRIARFLGSFSGILAGVLALVVVSQNKSGGISSGSSIPWIESFSINYELGIDGLNAPILILLGLFFPVLILFENMVKKPNRARIALYLLQFTSLVGLVCARDLFLLFGFWALSSVPVYFLSSVWSESEGQKAAIKYIVVTSISNAMFFLSVVLIYLNSGQTSFSIVDLRELLVQNQNAGLLDPSRQSLAFVFLLIAVALRVPVWPIHGWFPILTRYSSPSVTAIFCGAIIPSFLYIFMRLGYSLFPLEVYSYSDTIMGIGAVNLVMGAFALLAQRELRLFLTFLAVAQTGLLLIGIGTMDTAGLVGFCYHVLPVGLSMGTFGLFIGLVKDKAGKTNFLEEDGKNSFGGLIHKTPGLAFFAGTLLISVLGFPGTGSFIGQSLIVMGGTSTHPFTVGFLGLGLIAMLTAVFRLFRSFFLGDEARGSLADLETGEKFYLYPVVAMLIGMGLYPGPLIEMVRPSVLELLSIVS